MPDDRTLYIRGVPDKTIVWLEKRAKRKDPERSVAAEVRAILERVRAGDTKHA